MNASAGSNSYLQRAEQVPHPAAQRIATIDGYRGEAKHTEYNNTNLL
jgi:hypothetical protein